MELNSANTQPDGNPTLSFDESQAVTEFNSQTARSSEISKELFDDGVQLNGQNAQNFQNN